MLCDQASDEIFFIYQTSSHVPPLSFYIIGPVNGQGPDQPCAPLAIALGCAALPSPANLYRVVGASTYKINCLVSGVVVG